MAEKTILVTGGAGFIGSHFINRMVMRYPQYRFINVDLLTYAANQENISVSDAENYHFVQGDICDKKTMAALFEEVRPTHVINFAAESHVDNSIADPGVFVTTNISGVQVLLELARINGIKRFHQVSTDEVYGSLTAEAAPVTEDAPLAPNSPYSASKAAADLLVRAYHRTYNLDTVITRASNTFGPHQHVEKLIPRFITALVRREKVPLYGNGQNVRDWMYVSDHVDGIDAVFHKGKSGEIYNLGGNNEMTNAEITRVLLNLAGYGDEMIDYVTDRPGHDFRYAISSDKAKKEFGWKPVVSFEEGMQTTWKYYTIR